MVPCGYCRQLGCESCPTCIHHAKCLECNEEIKTDSMALIDHYICAKCYKVYIDIGEPISHSFRGLR